jgi:hypothetical protein
MFLIDGIIFSHVFVICIGMHRYSIWFKLSRTQLDLLKLTCIQFRMWVKVQVLLSCFQVTFYVRELKRIVGGVSTLVGNNEGSLVVQMRLPNIFGRGEKLQTEYSYGSQKTSTFNLSFTKPLRGNLNPVCVTNDTNLCSNWYLCVYCSMNKY